MGWNHQLKVIKILFIVLFLLPTTPFGQNWHSIGPAGKPFSICISSQYILVGTQRAGIAKSTDNGVTWKYVQNMPPPAYGSLPSNTISCLQTDPANIQFVYAGTGMDETSTGHGFFKSTDSGDSWVAKNDGLPQWPAIREICVNPFNTNELYIYCRPSGIFKSSNQGESWSLFFYDSYLTTTLIFDEDSTIQYAVGRDGIVHKWENSIHTYYTSLTNFFSHGFPIRVSINTYTNSLFYIVNSNIYKWNAINDWESLLNNFPSNDLEIVSAEIDQQNGTIFICTDECVFKSVDDGETWALIDNWSNMIVGVKDTKIVLTGFDGTYISTDGGIQWSEVFEGPKISRIFSGSIVNSDETNIIYAAGTDNLFLIPSFLFKSTNEGISWTKLDLPNEISPTVVKANPLNPDIVYVGCGDFFATQYGLYKTYDGGINWSQILPDSTIPVTAIDIPPNDTSRIMLGCPGFILESTNSGETWVASSYPHGTHNETNSVQISKTNPSTIYVASSANNIYENGFFITTDNGYTWERRVNGLPQGTSYTNIFAIAVHPQNDSIIFIGNAASIYKTTNQGLEWQTCSFPSFLDIGLIKDIQIAVDNPYIIFVAVAGYLVGKGGLYFSGDGGGTWEEILFPDTTDKSRTFINIIPMGDKYKTYAGTTSFGCYVGEIHRDPSIVSELFDTGTFYLLHNYPNPFNPTTTISYEIPEQSFVTIIVYDILGNEIATLVNEEKPAGSYEVEFNIYSDESASGGQNLVSGVYFYKLQVGNFVQTKKMVLMK